MATKFSVGNIFKLKGRDIFFDANILIFLFWPSSNPASWQTRVYPGVFKTLLKQKNTLWVDHLVISEVINAVFRIEYEKYLLENDLKRETSKFKSFRNSPEGKSALEDIHVIIEDDILHWFDVVGKGFSRTEILSMLVVNDLDFSDKSIVLTCQENSMVLLTDDVDYKHENLELLSGNHAFFTP